MATRPDHPAGEGSEPLQAQGEQEPMTWRFSVCDQLVDLIERCDRAMDIYAVTGSTASPTLRPSRG
jgi:hypothetical protein